MKVPPAGARFAAQRAVAFVDEVRLEMVVPHFSVQAVVRALYAKHSYEEPAFDLHPLHVAPGRGAVGMGRVGRLRKPTRGPALVANLRERVDLAGATIVGNLQRTFHFVTAAAGSFGVKSFRDPASLVLTGELKHHDALELLRRGVTAICTGHYASERPVLSVVREKLRTRLKGIRVEIARADRAPFAALS